MIFLLTLFSALGCGLIAGVFFAFSAFVMPAEEAAVRVGAARVSGVAGLAGGSGRAKAVARYVRDQKT